MINILKDRLKDSVQLGIIAGVLGNLPKVILMSIFNYVGLVKYSFTQMTAGIFVENSALTNPFALATGFVSDFAVASLLGTLLVYIIRMTGKDYVVSKGVLYGITIHIVVFGLAKTLNITSVELLNPLSNFIVLFPNIIFGIFSALIIERYGILDPEVS